MVRSGEKVQSNVGVGEERGWAEVGWGECADFIANRAGFIKMEFNKSPEEAFFTLPYLKTNQ